MYIIINKTKGIVHYHQGNFPNIDESILDTDDITIVSTYSNTVKVPVLLSDNISYNIPGQRYDWIELKNS